MPGTHTAPPSTRWLWAVLVASMAVVSWWAPPAGAHSFLVSTSPFQGERLGSGPEAVVLEFSEAVDLRSVVLELEAPSGRLERSLEPELAQGGLAVRSTVRDLDDGVYVVAWQALSAVDGHGSSGEFAFSVGDHRGAVPAAGQSEPVDRSSLASAWLFSIGLAGALGAAVVSVVGVTGSSSRRVRQVGRAGLLGSLAGVVVAAVSADGSKLLVLLVVAELLLVALALIGMGKSWRWSGAAAIAAAAVWSTRSHGANDGTVGWLVDFVHLVAGAAWLGSLLLTVVAGWRRRRHGDDWLAAVRRYARPALWLVLLLGAAGTLGAVRLVPTWSQLWGSAYGQVVLAKVALFALAGAGALVARWRGLAMGKSWEARGVMTGEAALVLTATVLAGLLSAGAPPVPAGASEQLLGPPPLGPEIVRDAGLAGQFNIEITSDGHRLDISVFGPSGPVPGTDIDAVVTTPTGGSSDLVPRPCGPGCFTQSLDLTDGTTSVNVSTSSSGGFAGGSFQGTLEWPPGERRPDLLQKVVERMRQVPELSLTETVDSGPGSVVTPYTFAIDGDGFVDLQPYAAGNLEQVLFRPGRTDRLTLYLPGSQIFGELELDGSNRITTERLVTPGHVITRQFEYPDGTTPPDSAGG